MSYVTNKGYIVKKILVHTFGFRAKARKGGGLDGKSAGGADGKSTGRKVEVDVGVRNQDSRKKYKCEYCGKMVFDIVWHVSQSHPEEWQSFFMENNVDLEGKVRCPLCGVFLKKLDGHDEKCPRTLEV